MRQQSMNLLSSMNFLYVELETDYRVHLPTTHTMWKELCKMFCCLEANMSRYISMVIDSPSNVMRNHR